MGAWPLEERRHSTRPSNGDMKPCPKCGEGCCEFNDHYRFEGIGAAPAWVCGCPPCRYRELVREAHRKLFDQPATGRQSRELPARVKRPMMKSPAVPDGSRRRLPPGADRLKKAH